MGQSNRFSGRRCVRRRVFFPHIGSTLQEQRERRDPNKYHWLFELLAERTDEDSVSLQISRLRLHLAAIAQQEWRVCELLHDELERLKPRLECDDPDVREKISSFLRRIFAYDVRMSMFEDALMLVPRTSSFVKHLLPRLAPLAEAPSEKPPQTPTHDHQKQLASGKGRATSANRAAANVLKTACRWIVGTATYSPIATLVDMFNLVPVLCITQANQDDLELQFHSKEALAHLGNATLRPENILAVQDIIAEVMQSPMWEARVAICELLHSLAVSNVFALRGCPDWMNFVQGNTLTLLKDPQLQVRETAAETLRGFFYQGVLDITDKLLETIREALVIFRRAHQDNWLECKTNFTDDQLAVISDVMLQPPTAPS
ncbi:proteasome activator complex subunit 4A-like [Haemaphysalis longicornis]